jgi:hypothetical protein
MDNDDDNVDDGSDTDGRKVRSTVDKDVRSASSGPELQSIQHDDKVQLFDSADGKHRWKCLWCNKTFVWNPTKALFHLARISKSDIAVCPGKIHLFLFLPHYAG